MLFTQYAVIINVVNYPELFHQTQFTPCRISTTISFIDNFPLNIVLNNTVSEKKYDDYEKLVAHAAAEISSLHYTFSELRMTTILNLN